MAPDVGLAGLRADVVLLKAADPAAFGELAERYRTVVYATAYRILRNSAAAEDVTQETFLRAFAARGAFRGESQVGWWLTRVASHLALNYSMRAREVTADIPEGADTRDLQAEVEGLMAGAAVRAAVALLPDSLRMPLIMREYSDLSCEEIADQLGLTAGAVRVRLLRARRELAKSLTSWS